MQAAFGASGLRDRFSAPKHVWDGLDTTRFAVWESARDALRDTSEIPPSTKHPLLVYILFSSSKFGPKFKLQIAK
jgi:hypothetical protein